MYEKITVWRCRIPHCFFKILIIMKLSIFLLLLTFFQVSALTFGQKISIKVNKVPLKTVLYELSKQTDYNFVADADLSRKIGMISIDVKNMEWNQVVERCFAGIDLKIVLNKEDKMVFIREALAKDGALGNRELVQQLTVSGKVTSIDGKAMPGVNVVSVNTMKKVFTDKQGSYNITVPSGDTLSFSFIGYSRQQQAVKGRTKIDAVLRLAEEKIDDVVVIGYGEVKKADITGAIGIVNVDELQKAPVSTFDQALAGRVAGVQVSGNDGQPGAGNNIVVRGGGSLTQDNSPLYVIDGFPVENYSDNPVSPADIETIQVLKDASSTAIYGSRGANGVIVITTKKGAKEGPNFNVNLYSGVNKVSKIMKMMEPYDFVKYQYALNPNTASDLYLKNGKTLEDYKGVTGLNMQELLYRKAKVQNADMAVRWGNHQAQYSVFFNFNNQDGAIINSGYQRMQGRFTLNQQLKKNIKLSLNTSYSKIKSFGNVVSDPTGGIASLSVIFNTMGYRPIAGSNDVDLAEELFDPETFGTADYRTNPVVSAKEEINDRFSSNLVMNGTLDFKLSNELVFKVRGGFNRGDFMNQTFFNSRTQAGNTYYSGSRGVQGGDYNRVSENWLNENLLEYNKRKGKNVLSALAGFTLQGNSNHYNGYSSYFLDNESIAIDGLDNGTSIQPMTWTKKWTLASFLGRVNYNIANKYLLTASVRADGSSKFRAENLWGVFPSGAFAWRMVNEPFFKRIASLSEAKLRISYGTTGNNRIDEYGTYSSVVFPYASYYSFNNAGPSKGAVLGVTAGNQGIKWETTDQLNIGYDIGLFKQRLTFTVDYYKKTTRDLLLSADLPYQTGYLNAYKNVGSIRNSGWEFTINTVNLRNSKLKWESSFNISFNKNKVLKLQEGQDYLLRGVAFVGDFHNAQPYISSVGMPAGLFYGALFDGLYQESDFDRFADGTYILKSNIPTNGRTRNSIQPGDMKFKDLNNDGIVSASDYTVIGSALPKHVGGFSNDFSYKGVDMNVFFQWSYGNSIMNANRLYLEQNTYNGLHLNLYDYAKDRWTSTNTNTSIPAVNSVVPRIYHSNIIEDGSYLRLKTVSIGYTFEPNLIKKLKLKSARVYVSGQNLWTWTNYSGQDPEVSVRNSALTPGFDWSAYPRTRIYTAGLNVNF